MREISFEGFSGEFSFNNVTNDRNDYYEMANVNDRSEIVDLAVYDRNIETWVMAQENLYFPGNKQSLDVNDGRLIDMTKTYAVPSGDTALAGGFFTISLFLLDSFGTPVLGGDGINNSTSIDWTISNLVVTVNDLPAKIHVNPPNGTNPGFTIQASMSNITETVYVRLFVFGKEVSGSPYEVLVTLPPPGKDKVSVVLALVVGTVVGALFLVAVVWGILQHQKYRKAKSRSRRERLSQDGQIKFKNTMNKWIVVSIGELSSAIIQLASFTVILQANQDDDPDLAGLSPGIIPAYVVFYIIATAGIVFVFTDRVRMLMHIYRLIHKGVKADMTEQNVKLHYELNHIKLSNNFKTILLIFVNDIPLGILNVVVMLQCPQFGRLVVVLFSSLFNAAAVGYKITQLEKRASLLQTERELLNRYSTTDANERPNFPTDSSPNNPSSPSSSSPSSPPSWNQKISGFFSSLAAGLQRK